MRKMADSLDKVRDTLLDTYVAKTGGEREAISELMTAEETCRYLKITSRTLYRYLHNHQIPAFKLGKEWRFVRSDLEQWIRDRTRGSVPS